MIRPLLAIALLTVATACSPSAKEDAIDDTHGISTDPNAAIGFITANPVLPEGVTIEEGDTVPRDDDGRPYTYALLGEPIPAMAGTMADGNSFDPASLNTWTIIDLWGIWCGDCIADAPYVAALVRAIDQDPDLTFLSIHTPANANRTTDAEMFGKYGSVANYFAEKGYNYPTLIDTDASIRDGLQISWTPSYLLVDPDGIIRGFRTDLSVAGGEPVKDFLKDVARVKTELRKAEADSPVKHASIGPGGAMGLTGAVPFNTNAIRAAFPDSEIVPGQHIAEGNSYPFFEVYAEGADVPLYRIEPDWQLGQVQSVSTSHPAVAGPSGEHVGQFRLSELSGEQRENCIEGSDDSSGMLICTRSTGDAIFQHVFDPSADKTDAVLIRMTYVPESGVAVD